MSKVKEEKELYYTPTIEEFHVGFECEKKTLIKTSSEDYDRLSYKEQWNKIVIRPFDAPTKTESREELSWFRVKYLDREDIESLGFEFEGNLTERTSKYSLISCTTTKLIYNKEAHTITITVQNGALKILHTVIVENKSELRKILIQAQILKNEKNK